MEIFLCNIGHPRTGTGYMTQVFASLGLDIGHEKLQKDGISDWAFSLDGCTSFCSPNLTFESIKPKYVIYSIRDPWFSIPSIFLTENNSLQKRNQFINLDKYSFNPDKAAFSLLEFDRLIRENRKIDGVVRIEHAQEDVQKLPFFEKEQFNDWHCPKTIYNARSHREMLLSEWISMDKELLNQLDKFCAQYGYTLISERIDKALQLSK